MNPSEGGLLPFASFEFLRGLQDTDGRMLGEVKAPASRPAAAITNLVLCGYEDARRDSGLVLNESALLQIVAYWPQLLNALGNLRAAVLTRNERLRPSMLDLWRIAHAAVCVVSFRRLENRIDDVVPVMDAALFKATAGMKYALRHLEISRLESPATIDFHPDVDALWHYIDAQRLLIGSSQVCAGPEMMIRELLDVLVNVGEPLAAPAAAFETLDIARLLTYADLLAVWETTSLLARAEEYTPCDEGRLAAICRVMLREICAATGIVLLPNADGGRGQIEDGLQLLFG